MDYTQLESEIDKSEFKNMMVEIEMKFNHQISENTRKYKEELLKTSLKKHDLVLTGKIIQGVDIENQPTNKIYDIYQRLCVQLEIQPMSAIYFSKFVSKWFGYSIKDKKISGKKHRIFVKDNGGLT